MFSETQETQKSSCEVSRVLRVADKINYFISFVEVAGVIQVEFQDGFVFRLQQVVPVEGKDGCQYLLGLNHISAVLCFFNVLICHALSILSFLALIWISFPEREKGDFRFQNGLFLPVEYVVDQADSCMEEVLFLFVGNRVAFGTDIVTPFRLATLVLLEGYHPDFLAINYCDIDLAN